MKRGVVHKMFMIKVHNKCMNTCSIYILYKIYACIQRPFPHNTSLTSFIYFWLFLELPLSGKYQACHLCAENVSLFLFSGAVRAGLNSSR